MGSWSGGSTRGWRLVRASVLDRDGHRCRMGDPTHQIGRHQHRAEGCQWAEDFPVAERGPLHVHHVLGRSVTGDDPAYLVASCGPCNMAAGDPATRDPQPRAVTAW